MTDPEKEHLWQRIAELERREFRWRVATLTTGLLLVLLLLGSTIVLGAQRAEMRLLLEQERRVAEEERTEAARERDRAQEELRRAEMFLEQQQRRQARDIDP